MSSRAVSDGVCARFAGRCGLCRSVIVVGDQIFMLPRDRAGDRNPWAWVCSYCRWETDAVAHPDGWPISRPDNVDKLKGPPKVSDVARKLRTRLHLFGKPVNLNKHDVLTASDAIRDSGVETPFEGESAPPTNGDTIELVQARLLWSLQARRAVNLDKTAARVLLDFLEGELPRS